MDDPDVVVGPVHPEADRLALIHAVRQRLREGRIDFEARRLDRGACLRLRALLEPALRNGQRRQDGEERCTNDSVTFHVVSPVLSYFPGVNFCTRLPWCSSPVYTLPCASVATAATARN